MANRKNTFLIKRSNIAGKVPAAGDLLLGELAINTADGILYASGTTANSILQIGWNRVARTGDTMTGGLFAPSITATTISATTYYNLPTDIRVTGGTYTTGTTTFTNNTGGTFSVSGFNTSVSPISVVNVSSLFSTGLASTGLNASGVTHSVFFGRFAGRDATSASNSNFMGNQAGYQATNANSSNFIGAGAGLGATNSSNSNFFGNGAGDSVANANNSNFFGQSAGSAASDANNSNFLGQNAGYAATIASNSTFIGQYAGWGAAAASNSNFLGQNAGYLADTADNSNFFGSSAGYGAGNAHHSNLMGYFAGYLASGAFRSNFIGNEAGREATSALNSNFIGNSAGYAATSASYSNFMGLGAGQYATNASYSTFIGQNAGNSATGASYSNIFGFNAGNASSAANSIGSNNIIIGTNISLSARTTNAINIGGILFGTGTYSTTTGSPIISATTGGRIGIGVVNPLATLHVSGDTLIQGNLTVTGNTQSLFSGNSSVELVKIIQNGSGDAFVVEDIANGDSSHFVINASGNTAIGLVQPLGNDKLTVSGNTSIYGGLSATTISATTYFGLPIDVRTTGVTISSGSVAFNRNDSMSAYTFGFSGVNINVISDDTNKRITFSASTGGSALPTLNQAQIFIGDTLNVAQARSVTGDVGLNFSGLTTIQPNVVTYSKIQTVSTNAILGSQSVSGGTVEEIPFVDAYLISGSVTALLLENGNNWDIDGVYTGTSITSTYQGQSYYSSRYWFTAVDDNNWIRLIRG